MRKLTAKFIQSVNSYLYGTREILGHSLEGVPVTWIAENSVDDMYNKCAHIVDSTIQDAFLVDGFKRDKMILNPQDILVANFAIRMDVSVEIAVFSNSPDGKMTITIGYSTPSKYRMKHL